MKIFKFDFFGKLAFIIKILLIYRPKYISHLNFYIFLYILWNIVQKAEWIKEFQGKTIASNDFFFFSDSNNYSKPSFLVFCFKSKESRTDLRLRSIT